MNIEIPKRFYEYVKALVDAGCFHSEKEAIAHVFECGLHEAEFDAAQAGGPDMELRLLRGKLITIEVPDEPERLEVVSRGYKVPKPKAATIAFLQALFDQYLRLKGSPLYKTNKRFRRKVDRMPHDRFYDLPEEIDEESLELWEEE